MSRKRLPPSASEPDVALTPAMFAILLALAGGPRHGLGIADDVAAQTDGATVLPVGTLYRSIAALVDAGLIAPSAPPRGEAANPRRIHYALTGAGRQALDREAVKLTRLMRWVRGMGVAPRTT